MSDAPGQVQQEMKNTLQKVSAFEKNNYIGHQEAQERLKKIILFRRGKNGAVTIFLGGSPGVGKTYSLKLLLKIWIVV